jgi:formiminoglutamate deiminase
LTTWFLPYAWLPGLAANVLVTADADRITGVTPDASPPPDAVRLDGLTIPGLANVHSHAFHRVLRARTQADRGTFWTWREQMYTVAAKLDPDRYLALARAVYGEMALAGITCVGEFHYVHHAPGGTPYASPNVMAEALIQAAADAGIRITLLDTCYLTGGVNQPLAGPQERFGDGSADRWAERASLLADRLAGNPLARPGAAAHSVRAVPPKQLPAIVEWARRYQAPLHAHLSEQRAENNACTAAYGGTPAQVLAEAGALGPRSTVVHGTHLSGVDINLIGQSGTNVCLCPTTERDLADGIGPAGRLRDAGAPITLGSDSHAVIDLFEEARAVELDERLRTEKRGHWVAADLLRAATVDGHAGLGWPEAGQIAPGRLADFVALDLNSVRLGGFHPKTAAESVVFAASAADVRHVVVGGVQVVRDGTHQRLPDVPAALQQTIAELSN